jgi:hypothetical protein
MQPVYLLHIYFCHSRKESAFAVAFAFLSVILEGDLLLHLLLPVLPLRS